MNYKSQSGSFLLNLLVAFFYLLLGLIAIVGGILNISSSAVLGVLITLLGFGILYRQRNDIHMVRKVEVSGAQLTSYSLVGHRSADLRTINKIRVFGIAAGRYGANSKTRLIEVHDANKNKAYIQLGFLNDKDSQELWSAIRQFLLKPGIDSPRDFTGMVARMGLKSVLA